MERASLAQHFGVSPSIPGCDLHRAFSSTPGAPCYVVWLADQPGFELRHPGAIFTANTRYVFDLSAGLVDVDGTVNSLDHQWDITSDLAPQVVATDPTEGETVPRDAPLSVNFSRPMDIAATSAAVQLTPPIPGTRVIRNDRDHGRFLVLPGHPLDPATAYTLTVTTAATDEHHSPLLTGATVHFRASQLRPDGHAVVIANQAGQGAVAVLLTALTPVQFGEPIPSETLLEAARCEHAGGCGLVPEGAPLVTFRDARLAPGSRWLAVVEADQTLASTPLDLRVIDLGTGQDREIVPGASMPAWSPDGDTLAYAAANGAARLYVPAGGATADLPAGAPLAGTPVWLGDGQTLALPVGPVGSRPAGVDLAIPALKARYRLPQPTGTVTDPVAAPSGVTLAVRSTTASGGSAWVTGASGSVQLSGDLTPIGFLDATRLLCADGATQGVVVVNATTREERPLAQPLPVGSAATAVVAPTGRQIAYIGPDSTGVVEAMVANSDGSGPAPLTRLGGGLTAVSVAFQ